MAVTDRISTLLEPTLTGMGYELVRVAMQGSAKSPTLQIMVERADGEAISVDDCETVSQVVSAQLDVADPIASAYTLEVSSPGIDRPLTRMKDFARFAGFEAKVQTREPLNGQRNFKGTLVGLEGDNVIIECFAGKEAGMKKVFLPYAAIEQARLVMNDALLKAAQEKKISA